MRIAIIGAGNVGSALGRAWSAEQSTGSQMRLAPQDPKPLSK